MYLFIKNVFIYLPYIYREKYTIYIVSDNNNNNLLALL